MEWQTIVGFFLILGGSISLFSDNTQSLISKTTSIVDSPELLGALIFVVLMYVLGGYLIYKGMKKKKGERKEN